MSSSYTEEQLIEQPAIQLMDHELGWGSVNAYEEPPSSHYGGLWLSGISYVEELTRDRSALSLVEGRRVGEMTHRPNGLVLFVLESGPRCNRLKINELLFEWKTSA